MKLTATHKQSSFCGIEAGRPPGARGLAPFGFFFFVGGPCNSPMARPPGLDFVRQSSMEPCAHEQTEPGGPACVFAACFSGTFFPLALFPLDLKTAPEGTPADRSACFGRRIRLRAWMVLIPFGVPGGNGNLLWAFRFGPARRGANRWTNRFCDCLRGLPVFGSIWGFPRFLYPPALWFLPSKRERLPNSGLNRFTGTGPFWWLAVWGSVNGADS